MLELIKGDLIELAKQGCFDLIVHGCNCYNTMGSGIALQVKQQFPEAYHIDCTTNRGDYNKLGTYTTYLHKIPNFLIINAYTQFDYGYNHKDRFEYMAFELILQKLLYNYSGLRFGFPHIGMGKAGGNPTKIFTILESFEKQVCKSGGSVTLVEYENAG